MTARQPNVSVVVPSYNSASYIAATVDSILAQTYTDLEVVIGDHSSTDGTWEIVSALAQSDGRLRVFRTEAGGGAERNWNRVTEHARGRLIKLVCGDDLVYPTCIEEQVAALDGHPDAVMATCARDVVDANGDVLMEQRGLGGLVGELDGAEAIRRTIRAGTNLFGEPACVLLRTDVVQAVGGWSAEDPYLIDLDMYVKALGHGTLVALPRALAAFRLSETQWSVDLVRQQARQTVSFSERVARESPGLLSMRDLRAGQARAYAHAIGRRLAYLWWRRRMAPPDRHGATARR